VKWAKEAAAVGRATGRRTGAEGGVVVVVAVVKLLAVEDNQGAAVDQTGVAKRLIVVCIGWKKDWEQLKIIYSGISRESK